MALGAHDEAPAPGAVALAHAVHAVDDAAGGEIGRAHDAHQLVNVGLRVLNQVQAGVHHLIEVVRRDVGRHAHGDAAGAVDEQVGQARGQHRGFQLFAVVVGHHVDGLLVNVGKDGGGDALESALGVAVGGGAVAINGAEVALSVNERVAHGELLRHAHQRLIGGGVAVRVEAPEHVAHHAGALHIGAVPDVVGLVHGKQHAPMHRLETVTGVGQGAPDDDAHGVIQIAAPHLLFKADGESFLGERRHDYMYKGKVGKGAKGAILDALRCCRAATLVPDCAPIGQPSRLFFGERWHNRRNVLSGVPA